MDKNRSLDEILKVQREEGGEGTKSFSTPQALTQK